MAKADQHDLPRDIFFIPKIENIDQKWTGTLCLTGVPERNSIHKISLYVYVLGEPTKVTWRRELDGFEVKMTVSVDDVSWHTEHINTPRLKKQAVEFWLELADLEFKVRQLDIVARRKRAKELFTQRRLIEGMVTDD